ncbi:PDDEXK nuclease domain-containing protein [uncultured Bacteroides sp.]|uniref:PDDEXK nuclease domain-containing protein n=1 Tax=uncultured Bacteroides sp. TaxID=162156 RepID=UPI0025E08E3F|nr:PDDEXK nuclease domain-containing protein [uncultured Bacteroides sp.]
MNNSINILDKDYLQWVKELSSRYRQSQIKAAVKVNSILIEFYWELGRDIISLGVENKYGGKFYATLSTDLRNEMPGVEGLSESNIRYAKRFFQLYSDISRNLPQVVEELCSVPWGHHRYIIDKFSAAPEKALFYVHQTIENGWSRAMLLNFIDTDLYERHGKAITNFQLTLPAPTSDLAQELTKDPYSFEFLSIRKDYNERQLKDTLLHNITRFLVELGTGFAYVGREYRLQIGQTEKFIDLLFYNLTIRCYVVVEVKIDKFDSADIGQLGTYVTAVNHLLCRKNLDNPTIGLLICKSKDNLLAQYALESSSQPIGISEFELSKLYPTEVKGTIPSIEEIETKLSDK